jgi:ribosome recycling factor
MLDEILEDAKQRMEETRDHLKREFALVRTGRASSALLDGIRVDYYGVPTPLKQVASISVPEASLIVIQPWDVSILEAIEKAILRSELGLTPNSDGKIIRLPVPPLTEERRKELVKQVRRMAEETRIAARNIRRDANDTIKELLKEKEISEDMAHRSYAEVQKLTERIIGEIDKLLEKKEAEVLET